MNKPEEESSPQEDEESAAATEQTGEEESSPQEDEESAAATEQTEEEESSPQEEEKTVSETDIFSQQSNEADQLQSPDVRSLLRLEDAVSDKPFKAILISSVPFVFGSAVHFSPQEDEKEPSVPPDNVVVSLIKESDDPYFKG